MRLSIFTVFNTVILGLLLSTSVGCRAFVGAHYAYNPGTHEMEAACRIWTSTLVMTGETVSGCGVPNLVKVGGDKDAIIEASGWVSRAAGGGKVDTGDVHDIQADHTSQRANEKPATVTLAMDGASGIAVANRDDDIGIETASVARWFMGIWGLVTAAGDLASEISDSLD